MEKQGPKDLKNDRITDTLVIRHGHFQELTLPMDCNDFLVHCFLCTCIQCLGIWALLSAVYVMLWKGLTISLMLYTF